MKEEPDGTHLLKALIITGIVIAATLVGGRWLVAQEAFGFQVLGQGEDRPPLIATGPDGSIHVFWSSFVYDPEQDIEQYLLRHMMWDGVALREMPPAQNMRGYFYAVTMDDEGNVHLAWGQDEEDPDVTEGCEGPSLRYSRWDGEQWSPHQVLSEPCHVAWEPAIISGPGNVLHIFWWDVDSQILSDRLDIYVSLLHTTSTDGGYAWSVPDTVVSFPPQHEGPYRGYSVAAADSTARVHLVWSDHDLLFYTHLEPNDVEWAPPLQIADQAESYPSLAVDAYDRLHLVWLRGHMIYHLTSKGYLTPSALGTAQPLWAAESEARIVADDQGDVYVAWKNTASGSYPSSALAIHLFCSRGDGQGNWSAPLDVSDPIFRSSGYNLAADAQGILHLAWSAEDSRLWPGQGEQFVYRAVSLQETFIQEESLATPEPPANPFEFLTNSKILLTAVCCTGLGFGIGAVTVVVLVLWWKKRSDKLIRRNL